MKATTIFTIILIIISFSCQKQNLLRETLTEAGNNSAELQSVIDSYDGERKDIAEYTVGAIWGHRGRTGHGIDSLENLYRELPGAYVWLFDPSQLIRGKRYAAMPLSESKDSEVLTADYLKHNIDDAYKLWKSRPWNQDLPRGIFCEMILPYRIGDEPLTDWRSPYREWLRDMEDTIAGCAGSVAAARIIASHIGSAHYNDQLSTPHRSALNLLNTPIGYCREDCDRTVYAMRAMGVPVAIDLILVSPENGASHSWTVVWDNIDRMTRMFDNGAYLPTRDSVHYDHRRKGKIYRQTFAPDFDRIKRFRYAKNPPAALLNPWLKDVTAEYFGHNKVTVEIFPDKAALDDAVYLGIFAGRRFRPIDIAELNGKNAVFTDIEPNLIYAPVTADGTVCGYPFLLDDTNQVRYIKGENQTIDNVRLTRKFPLRFLHKERLASTVGLQIQSGPTAHGPWQEIETIRSAPDHSYRRIRMNRPLQHRYIRLFKPTGTNALVDRILACRDTLGTDTLPLSVIGDADRYNRLLKTGYTAALEPGNADCIVRVDSEEPVTSLFILPPNDDNFVVPSQEYELLYFAGPEGWKSLGRKVSTGFSIGFEAPHGALLWLKNLTKGKEEQIFVYRDSCQLFNIDLHDFKHY